jgi:hypothetical protein
VKLSPERIAAEVTATGFRPEVVEKVAQLLELLRGLAAHPYLRDRWALKGGTALNLFIFDVPRLSIDVDINYVGAADLVGMQTERPQVTEALRAICLRADLTVDNASSEHAGERWVLRYPSALGSRLQGDLAANKLLPVLRTNSSYAQSRALDWAERMVDECRSALEVVLPFTASELAFLDRLLDHGIIDPTLLTDDQELAMRIAAQPHLQWKASHARDHRARSGPRSLKTPDP